MYTCAELTPLSAALLKWIVRATLKLEDKGFIFQTHEGNSLPHHMTICLGSFDEKLNNREILEQKSILSVSQIVYDLTLGVCAAPVNYATARVEKRGYLTNFKTIKTINKFPHITLCMMPGSKPKMSNDMLEDTRPQTVTFHLDDSYDLEAIIKEIP